MSKGQQFATGKKEAGKNVPQGGGEVVGGGTLQLHRSLSHCMFSIVTSNLAYETRIQISNYYKF